MGIIIENIKELPEFKSNYKVCILLNTAMHTVVEACTKTPALLELPGFTRLMSHKAG